MRMAFLLFVSLCCSVSGFSQVEAALYPNFSGFTLKEMLADTSWQIIHQAKGELNNDAIADYALIVESKNDYLEKECESCKARPIKARIILVLLSENGEELAVKIQNNRFIARSDEGGMLTDFGPYELKIEEAQLRLKYQFLRAHQTYIFEFVNGAMPLVEAKSSGASGVGFESDRYLFKEGIILSERSSRNEEGQTDTIPIQYKPQFKKLSEFEGMNQWEVADCRFL